MQWGARGAAASILLQITAVNLHFPQAHVRVHNHLLLLLKVEGPKTLEDALFAGLLNNRR